LVSFFFFSLRFAFLSPFTVALRSLPVVTKHFLKAVPVSAVHPTCQRGTSTEQPQDDWFRPSFLSGSNFSSTGLPLKTDSSSFCRLIFHFKKIAVENFCTNTLELQKWFQGISA
jgi:hypothetical protein